MLVIGPEWAGVVGPRIAVGWSRSHRRGRLGGRVRVPGWRLGGFGLEPRRKPVGVGLERPLPIGRHPVRLGGREGGQQRVVGLMRVVNLPPPNHGRKGSRVAMLARNTWALPGPIPPSSRHGDPRD